MIRIVILIVAIMPSLLILGYWTKKADVSWRSEAIWSAFCLGAFSTFAALGTELALARLDFLSASYPVAASAANAVFLAAIPEESIKFFVLVVFAEKHVDVRRLQDVIVLGLAVSLGFATLENVGYVITGADWGDWRIVAALRAITAVHAHGLDGLAMGALLALARLHGIKGSGIKEIWAVKSALIVPVLLHAAYDFPLLVVERQVAKLWFGVAWVAVVVLSSIFVFKLFKKVHPQAALVDQIPRDALSTEAAKRLVSTVAVGLITSHALPREFASVGEATPSL